MKATELIKDLQNMMELAGDKDIDVYVLNFNNLHGKRGTPIRIYDIDAVEGVRFGKKAFISLTAKLPKGKEGESIIEGIKEGKK